MFSGYIQVYTGNGKGKTTAAIGLAIRAIGAGLNVYIGQFIKSKDYSEHITLKEYLPILTLEVYGRGCFINGKPEDIDIKLANDGLERAKEIIYGQKHHLVILDEINIALNLGLIDKNKVLDMLHNKPSEVEIVLTGRYADKEIIEIADLVTEMREVKHYYSKGILARDGIEK